VTAPDCRTYRARDHARKTCPVLYPVLPLALPNRAPSSVIGAASDRGWAIGHAARARAHGLLPTLSILRVPFRGELHAQRHGVHAPEKGPQPMGPRRAAAWGAGVDLSVGAGAMTALAR
jgi:hypothetical protein